MGQNGGKTNNQRNGDKFVNGDPVAEQEPFLCLNDAVTIVTNKRKALSLHDPLLLRDFLFLYAINRVLLVMM